MKVYELLLIFAAAALTYSCYVKLRKRSVKRAWRLIWARLRCNYYLLFRGMWRGECELTGYHKDDGRVSYVAAVTGSLFKGTIEVKRVFWNEHTTVAETKVK